MARVETGMDGKVRVADIKMGGKIYRHPDYKMVPLLSESLLLSAG